MNLFHSLLKPHVPPVFNPRVTPDPTESERLEAKLHEASRRLNERFEKTLLRRAKRTAVKHDSLV